MTVAAPSCLVTLSWTDLFPFPWLTPGRADLLQAAEKEKASQGRVVATGEGRTSSEGKIVPCPFKPGDNVKFMEYAPVEIKVGKATVLFSPRPFTPLLPVQLRPAVKGYPV